MNKKTKDYIFALILSEMEIIAPAIGQLDSEVYYRYLRITSMITILRLEREKLA